MIRVGENVALSWLGHASFRIEFGDKVIYIDPWKIKRKEEASLVLITHSHFDHLSVDDVKRVQGSGTVIVATRDSASKLKGDIRIVKPGDSVTVNDIGIEAVPAYNIGKSYHPKSNGWVGFILDLGGTRIYHAGDTDAIPEMKKIKADVALLPVGGTYTMTAQEAAEIANEFKPKTAIPMHWGTIVGSREDAERFKDIFEGETLILEPEG
ncbi:MAG: metal-dependent hydrolase [Deltaproteobacteria bacterium]|jgi:L-ascorbate metabolism protein UlaG (beta-lactamase superfamily)|nr:MAG: metal-dependent hydrolase [Deltaproteobacteria bacterium]